MNPLELVRLAPLMNRASGRPEVKIGLIDGPVAMGHPDLAGERIREIAGKASGRRSEANSVACLHGTFVAGILCAKRGSSAPAICPDCTLLVRPIFGDTARTTPEELAAAIIECVEARVQVINLSLAIPTPSPKGEREIVQAINQAATRRVIVVAAAGNQGTVGSSVITRHPWVIPVVACDRQGRPMNDSNLGGSIGMRGLRAPGENVTSLGTGGTPMTAGGTSVAAPFVSGGIALLWSEFPAATAIEVKTAVTRPHASTRRAAIVPPMLDVWAAYQSMEMTRTRRRIA